MELSSGIVGRGGSIIERRCCVGRGGRGGIEIRLVIDPRREAEPSIRNIL